MDQVIGGQEIFLGKHGKIVAKIVPLDKQETMRKPGALKGKIWIRNDFEGPMPELWDAIKAK